MIQIPMQLAITQYQIPQRGWVSIPPTSDPRPEIETAGYIARTCTQSYNLMPNLVTPMSERGFPHINVVAHKYQ